MKNAALFPSALLVGLACVGAWSCAQRAPAGTSGHQPIPTKLATEPAGLTSSGRIFLSSTQLQQALAAGIIDRPVKSLLTISTPMRFGDYQWNETAVPAGPSWVRVDLRTQLISVFRSGHEIGTAVIVYGGDNKETPTGKLHILAKARKHRSSVYDAEMPYTLRLTNDGVSIHASSVRWGTATHGCIGVPPDFARRLFDTMRVGDDVVIIRGRRATA